ncbi:PD-(D/E)XK nuclease family transposase [Tunicatimonas pelagia]|uniref:PD-(D/E)XK nuclease family transposase n=1 Tax=Tunicatimonas pelagia TaxID=931531 RepID=UPI002666DF4E|nr:PD-(D/E)XK nuclease family transposase [Tunicatimonas pelagia]WKN46397.1 PD-(D/E)XK nuclease family transposase [Tunicatimonas pelagia]
MKYYKLLNLQCTKFSMAAEELETGFDKWMYVIRNLNKLDRVPKELREGIFERLFEVAEIARFSPEEVQAYEDSLKSYRDLKNSLDTAFEEGIEQGIEQGIEKGIEQGIEQVARNGIKQGKSDELIMDLTGLSLEQVTYLKEKLKSEE